MWGYGKKNQQGALILDFLAFTSYDEINVCGLSHLPYSIFVMQLKWTKTGREKFLKSIQGLEYCLHEVKPSPSFNQTQCEIWLLSQTYTSWLLCWTTYLGGLSTAVHKQLPHILWLHNIPFYWCIGIYLANLLLVGTGCSQTFAITNTTVNILCYFAHM